MYEDLKQRVLEANLKLVQFDLVTLTWGNVSEIDRNAQIVAIKPSGVSYDTMTRDDIVIVDMDGHIIEGTLRPSSDLATHLELYKADVSIGGVVHTHSPNATSFAQAGRDLEAIGTTHADHFYGTVPCTRPMTSEEIENNYELNTGTVIVDTFKTRELSMKDIPACLVYSHGPFVWGSDAEHAVENAIVLEVIAHMNYQSFQINPTMKESMQRVLLDKHYLRKHGANAYYGQSK